MNQTLGSIHFWLTFVGVYAIFIPMHFVGLAGTPRRYAFFTAFDFMAPLMVVDPARRTALDVTAIYWHFLDGLWVYIFLLLMRWS